MAEESDGSGSLRGMDLGGGENDGSWSQVGLQRKVNTAKEQQVSLRFNIWNSYTYVSRGSLSVLPFCGGWSTIQSIY